MSKDIKSYNEKSLPHGYWETYYDNSELYFKGDYINGKEHGYWEIYHDNGKLEFKGNYVNGKVNGYCERYYNNGQIEFKGNYIDDKEDGWFLINYYDTYYKFFFKNGEAYYKNRRFSFYSF